MTKESTKLARIKAIKYEPLLCGVYGNVWQDVKKYTNINGWCRLKADDYPNIEKEFNRHKPYWWRPVELIGFNAT